MEKLARYPGLVLFIVCFVVYMTLEYVFGMTHNFLKATIAASIAVLLSPRRKIIETQNGKKKQITWVFLKKPIIID
jgi:hypothetical protein